MSQNKALSLQRKVADKWHVKQIQLIHTNTNTHEHKYTQTQIQTNTNTNTDKDTTVAHLLLPVSAGRGKSLQFAGSPFTACKITW